MISYNSGDVYLCKESDIIIFNPVGVRDNNKGFLKKVKRLYPNAYRLYKDEVWSYNEKELLGEIQLIEIADKRLILNGFCIEKSGKINKLALAKTLVELCNLAYEYEVSVGIEYGLGVQEIVERRWIAAIIREVFGDVDISVQVYDRNRK